MTCIASLQSSNKEFENGQWNSTTPNEGCFWQKFTYVHVSVFGLFDISKHLSVLRYVCAHVGVHILLGVSGLLLVTEQRRRRTSVGGIAAWCRAATRCCVVRYHLHLGKRKLRFVPFIVESARSNSAERCDVRVKNTKPRKLQLLEKMHLTRSPFDFSCFPRRAN